MYIISGATGLLLNGVCFLLIGGYTFHQGSFLYVTESGDVVLNKVVVNDSVRKGGRRLSRTRNIFSSPPKKRQGLWETTRDIIGKSLFVKITIFYLKKTSYLDNECIVKYKPSHWPMKYRNVSNVYLTII